MKKTYQLDFQKIRRKTQIKDILSFEIYLKNIFGDLAKRDFSEKEGKTIEKITFIAYMNLPFIVGEKIFNVFNKTKTGHLTQTEFVTGIINLYGGGLEETQKMIFNILDFDSDKKIIPEDSRLLILFIKNLSNPPNNIMKIKTRSTITDEENLDEINLIIKNFFDNKLFLTYEEYKHNIETINSDVFFLFIYFLYNNKPFNDSSIKILKLLTKSNQLLSSVSSNVLTTSSDDCGGNETKSRIRSPSRLFKSFISELVDMDLDEIQRECGEDTPEEEITEENYNLINENFYNISVPELNTKINLYKLKTFKDYLLYDTSNRKIVGSNVIKNTFENFKKRNKELEVDEIKSSIIDKKNHNLDSKRFKEDEKIYDKIKNKKIENKNLYEEKTNKCINKSLTEDNKLIIWNNNTYNNDKKSPVKKLKDYFPKIEINMNSSRKNSDRNQKNTVLNDENKEANIHTGIDSQNLNISGLSKQNNSTHNLHSNLCNDSLSGGEEIIIKDIIYENYIFKSRNNNKLKKYYIVLIGMDLFYFSNSKKKKLRGMHNLSGSYIYEDENVIKVREEFGKNKNEPSTVIYYPFKLFLKKKARVYYCPSEEEALMWVNHIRAVTKFRDIYKFYDFADDLGSGKFGQVKLSFQKQTKKKFAVKIINKTNLKGIELEMVKTEVEIMKFCRHKNIVKLIDNFEDIDNIYIVLEYLSGGNLNFFLSRQQTLLSEDRIKELIHQIGSGIFYLHNFGIIHRDLKPENSMMTDLTDNGYIKIVDFGLSKILGVTEKSNESYGTLSYAAPEVLEKNDYNNKIDIWSLGIIMYFLICGYLPFIDKNNNFTKIANDIKKADIKFDNKIWSRISNVSKDLVMKCLERDFKKRLDILQFLNHAWFRKLET